MAYGLGQVAKHVAEAAEYFGRKFGIVTVGGYRANGGSPNSDHPKGLALDFMTRSKSTGDALAADVIKNANTWGVKYVIWWRQIWEPGTGWQPYHGTPNPHTDHVHVSFNAKPGSAVRPTGPGSAVGGLVPDGIVSAVKGVADQLADMAKAAASMGRLAELVVTWFMPNNIIRGAAGLMGTMFILLGIWFLSREARKA